MLRWQECNQWDEFDKLIPVLLVLVGLTCAGCAAASADSIRNCIVCGECFLRWRMRRLVGRAAGGGRRCGNAPDHRQCQHFAGCGGDGDGDWWASSRSRRIWAGICPMSNFPKGGMNETEVLRGSMTLRVPSDSLEEALERLQALATDVHYLNIRTAGCDRPVQ